jgi:hypothetical protein
MLLLDLFEDAEEDEDRAHERGRTFWKELTPHLPHRLSEPSWAPKFSSWPPSRLELAQAEKQILQNPEWLAYYARFGWRNWRIADDWRFGTGRKPLFRFDDVPQIGMVNGKAFPDRTWVEMDLDGQVVKQPQPYDEYYIVLPAALHACREVVRMRGPVIRENLPYLMGQYFVRFGKWPKNERSRNWLVRHEEVYENGVSAYGATFSPHIGRWMLDTVDYAATSGTMQELIYGDREIYLVQGDEVGEGADGEPVLRNVRLIKQLQKKDILVPGVFDPVKDVED